MGNQVLLHTAPPDPSDLGFPDTLPLELAMNEAPVKEVFEAYGLGKQDYLRLCADPLFVQAIEENLALLKKEGTRFKVKARAQALELLKTSFALCHDQETPPSVKADLIKFTVRAAGLDESVAQKANAQTQGINFQIVMNLGE